MDATIIKIGNSKGIRIPAVILNELNLNENDKVIVQIENNMILIRPYKPRNNWANAFKQMHENGDDRLVDLPKLTNDDWL
jgi:antitoxin MazE